MKTKYFIWLSALALVILILSQYFIITETFRTKKTRINETYIEVIRKGLYQFEDLLYSTSLDSLYAMLDETALQFLFSGVPTDTISDDFTTILNEYEDLNLYLKIYLKQNGLDPGFHSVFVIRSLTLFDIDRENTVYLDTLLEKPQNLKDPIPVGSLAVERNYFRMTYDYFISVDHTTGMIMKETKLTLVFAFFSIILVFSVFYMTLRNMMLQKRLSDLKSDFINNMTHELKTPLSTISVASSSLINPDLKIKQERIVELSNLIKKQNKHLSDLIDRILDISIWEKDQVKLHREKIDIEKFIIELVNAFSLEINGEKPEISLEMDIRNRFVFLDEIHMTTVLNNLLLNSQKYAVKKLEITIKVASDAYLSIVVSDNGPGISRDDQKHVFEKFYRGSESKSRAIKGLGLGLYYVKQIVKAHGGEILLESDPGKGTSFEIIIPLDHEYTVG